LLPGGNVHSAALQSKRLTGFSDQNAPIPAIRSAIDARSRDHASNSAGGRSIAQKLCHAKAMEREDRCQIGSAKGVMGHHGRREHNPWPGISKHGHPKIEVPVIRSGDELVLVLRE